MNEKITVILVVGPYLLRTGLENLLSELQGLMIVDVFDGTEKNISEKIMDQKPDMVIINPGDFGSNLISIINQIGMNGTMIVGLIDEHTLDNVKSHFNSCLQIFDDKYELLEDLKRIVGKRLNQSPTEDEKDLSEREKHILKMVTYGNTNQEIANKLFLSIHTITTHRKNITRKLGIKTVSGLTVYALMNKIVDINRIPKK